MSLEDVPSCSSSPFYFVSQTKVDTKQVSHVLGKWGKELQEPHRMYTNPNQILFVEAWVPIPKSRRMEFVHLLDQNNHALDLLTEVGTQCE